MGRSSEQLVYQRKGPLWHPVSFIDSMAGKAMVCPEYINPGPELPDRDVYGMPKER